MSWIYLIIAGLFEVGFTFSLAHTKGATGKSAAIWYTAFAVCLVISMALLVKSTQTLPIGTAYAVWTGIGAVGTVLVGILFFGDSVSFWRIFFIFTLVASIIGLKLVSTH